MSRKILTLTLSAALFAAVGCGGGERPEATAQKKSAAPGPAVSLSAPWPWAGGSMYFYPYVIDSETRALTITNVGDQPLTVSVEVCPTAPAAYYSITPITGVTLAPGASVDQNITFAPQGLNYSQMFVGCVDVVTNDPANPRVNVPMAAWGSDYGSCTTCHGDTSRLQHNIAPAPPSTGLPGNAAGVGAHLEHLAGGGLSRSVDCWECHEAPAGLHGNGDANVVWGAKQTVSLATAGGTLAPQYDLIGKTCSNVACHGATLAGGTNTTPNWTVVNGTQAACGTCHGLPPATTSTGAAHPAATDCGSCHSGYTSLTVNVQNHVNGRVDGGGGGGTGCATCHGVPPTDHVAAPAGAGGSADFVDCGACHPGYDPATQTANAATHQNGVRDFTLGTTSCNVCHSSPPPVPHTTSTTCGDCHTGYTSTTPNATLHRNGVVDVAGCNACHGAPPATHVAAPASSGGTANFADCSQCHTGYTAGSVNSATHQNGTPDYAVGTGSCAICHGAPPPLSSGQHPQDVSCGSCHAGYTTNTVNLAAHRNGTVEENTTCASCHGNPPAATHLVAPAGSGGTGSFTNCTSCHPATSGSIVTATHRNGAEDINLGTTSCNVCHNAPPPTTHAVAPAGSGGTANFSTCASCHTGYTATTVNATAHRNGTEEVALGTTTCTICHAAPPTNTHLVAPAGSGGTGTFTTCADCHAGYTATTVPATGHRDGTEQVTLGTASCTTCHAAPPPTTHVRSSATAGGTASFATCASCHAGYTATTVPATGHRDGTEQVTLAAASCNVCHGGAGTTGATAPPAPHVQDNACGNCHGAGYTATTVSATLHRNNVVDVPGVGCASCHGNPPATTHVVAPAGSGGTGTFTACGSCHPATSTASISVTATHRDGLVEAPLGTASCATCHATPPPATHVASPAGAGGSASFASCGACHAGYTATTVPATGHRNGTEEVALAATSCSVCHGAPPPFSSGSHPTAPLAGADATACGNCHTGYTATTVSATAHRNATVEASVTCTSCHGNPPTTTSTGATHTTSTNCTGCHPATSVGSTAVTATHRNGTVDFSGSGACDSCHAAPPADHVASPAGTQGATASFGTCGVCHPGADLATSTAPTAGHQNGTNDYTLSATSCTVCHGDPPTTTSTGATHSTSTACGSCHPSGYTNTAVLPAFHRNGTVDLANQTCTSCHGDATRTTASIQAAPPADRSGNTATTARGVGAHQAHLVAGTMRVAMVCTDCHAVPTTTGHSSGTVNMTWGLLARARGVTPSFNGTTCASYCHGSSLTTGSNHAPSWTTVNGSQDACGTCHGAATTGLPSTGQHSTRHGSVACTSCHTGTASATSTTHVNGVVEMVTNIGWNATSRSCSPSCHGNQSWGGTTVTVTPTLAAEPQTAWFGTVASGASATQTVRIRNLGTSTLTVNSLALCSGTSTEFTLSSTAGFTLAAGASQTVTVTYRPTAAGSDTGCFNVNSSDTAHNPTAVTLAGNIGSGTGTTGPVISARPTPLAFGTVTVGTPTTRALTVANTGTASLSVTSVGLCAGTSAGITVSPATLTVAAGQVGTVNVTWNATAAGAVAAASCVTLTSNDTAHTPLNVAITGTASSTPPPPTCNVCHGVPPTDHVAAPTGTQGGTANFGTCGACHPGYDPATGTVVAATHQNGTRDFTLGTTSCNVCHGAPPTTTSTGGTHVASTACGDCHTGFTSTTVSATLHRNGVVDVTQTCSSCHGVPPADHVVAPAGSGGSAGFGTCSACHPGADPATGTAPTTGHLNGSNDFTLGTTSCAVCHASPPPATHVAAPAGSGGTASFTSCGACHAGYTATTIPATGHRNGTEDIALAATSCGICHGSPPPFSFASHPRDPLAGTSAATCANCHTGYTATTVPATGHRNGTNDANVTCTSCHGNPPATISSTGAAHSTSTACASCHPSTSTSSTGVTATHRNGVVDASGGSCTSCHGDATRTNAAIAPAPPADRSGNTAVTARGVGAHQAHLVAGTMRVAMVCTDCHSVPTAGSHSTGTVEMSWSLLARARGINPTWSGTSCSNYCHGSSLTTGSNHAPTWTTVNGTQDACGTCHGAATTGRPSTGEHTTRHGSVACTSCHTGTASATSTTHVNGVVEMVTNIGWNATNRSCSPSCHGNQSWGGTTVTVTPTVAAEPQTALFGSVNVGSSATATVRIRNLGTSTLTVNSLALCAGTTAEFSLSSTAGFTLAAGASQTVTVTYRPTAEGSDTGCFNVNSSDTAHNPTAVTLSGTGAGAPPAAPAISATPNPLAFGTVTVGTPATRTLTVSNTGTASLSVTSIGTCAGTTAGFTVSPTTLTVAAGGTGTVNVTWNPTAAGTVATASCVAFTSNASPSPYNVPLTGTAQAGTTAPVISATPNPLDFGNVASGANRQLTLTVANTGTATLNVSGISRCSGTSTEFAISSTGSFTVAAGASVTRTITYTPSGRGLDTGCISIASNAAGSPTTVNVTGRSASVISASPNPVAFGTVTSGSSRQLTVTISNTGTRTLNVSGVTRCSGTSTEYTISSSASFTVSAGSTTTRTITYTPTAAGADTGCFAFASDDSATPTYNVNVSGTGG